MAKLDFDSNVKVLFESNNEGETLVIEGNIITVKAAIMSLLQQVAEADDISLVELLQEFVEVTEMKEMHDELNKVMGHLGITRE